MQQTVLPERALATIVPVVEQLLDGWFQLPAPVQNLVEQLYARMRDEFRAAQFDIQRGLAVARFLAAIDELPDVHALAGDTIAPTYGLLRRSARPLPDMSVLDTLPPSLAPMQHQSAEPPDEMFAMPEEPGAPGEEALPPPMPPAPPHGSGHTAHDATRDIDSLPPAPLPSAPHMPATGATQRSLTRYPALDYPREVALGTRTSLMVLLEREQRQPQAVATFIAIADSAPAPPELEVVVRAHAFDIEGSNTQVLEVSRDDDSELRFVLIPRQAGEQELRVDFYQHGRRIGTVRRLVQVHEQALPRAARGAHVPLEPLELGPAASSAPDLELCVESDRNDGQRLYFTLHSTDEAVDLHHVRAGSVRLRGSPFEKLQQVYEQLSRYAGQLPSGQVEQDRQRAELERIGRTLWDELVSDELKAGYWQWKDRISSLLITSDEPWIPWEMIKPYRWDEHNRLIDEPFLCEKFAISRWLSGPGPADRVPIQYLVPVAPKVSNLASVAQELTFLRTIDQLKHGVSVIEPYSEPGPVIELFRNGSLSVLHIVAHGGFDALQPDDSRIMLDGGELRPADILARFGGARPRPLVFINACHGARLAHALTGLGGWAERMVRDTRVAAFVGTAWEVNDRLALVFAQAFYEALLRDDKSIGESFLLARRRVRDAEPSNSTWLAYVLYADPGAHLAPVSDGASV